MPSRTASTEASTYLPPEDLVGDIAYTVGLEHTSAYVDGQPRTNTLRATQVYRREAGEWRAAHRHGDTMTE